MFAVWKFMSLLKTLQRGLTCVDDLRLPSRLTLSQRLVNEIVMGEESNVYETDAGTHSELCLPTMRECGASEDGASRKLKSHSCFRSSGVEH
jgi:Protein of unknown function (DUF3050)